MIIIDTNSKGVLDGREVDEKMTMQILRKGTFISMTLLDVNIFCRERIEYILSKIQNITETVTTIVINVSRVKIMSKEMINKIFNLERSNPKIRIEGASGYLAWKRENTQDGGETDNKTK